MLNFRMNILMNKIEIIKKIILILLININMEMIIVLLIESKEQAKVLNQDLFNQQLFHFLNCKLSLI